MFVKANTGYLTTQRVKWKQSRNEAERTIVVKVLCCFSKREKRVNIRTDASTNDNKAEKLFNIKNPKSITANTNDRIYSFFSPTD